MNVANPHSQHFHILCPHSTSNMQTPIPSLVPFHAAGVKLVDGSMGTTSVLCVYEQKLDTVEYLFNANVFTETYV